MSRLLAGLVCGWLAVAPEFATPRAPQVDGVAGLLYRLEQALQSGDGSRYIELLAPGADRQRARAFATAVMGGDVTRAVVRERDRGPLRGSPAGDGYRLVVEVLLERGSAASLATWRLDVRRLGGAPGEQPPSDEWGVSDEETLTSLSGLHRLSLNPRRELSARDFIVTSEDFQLRLADGQVFVADADGEPTALVLLGHGEMTFKPTPDVEREQVRIFSGADVLQTPFEAAFVRSGSFDLGRAIAEGSLSERPVEPRDLRRADDVFRAEVVKSFIVDLGDLSADTWSLSPTGGDLLAEVRTRRFDTLTYALSHNEPEDISLFDRKRRRNISIYASRSRLAELGPSYDDSAKADYRPISYDVRASFEPDRAWIEGRTRITLEVRSPGTTTLTLRLGETLVIRSVILEGYGRLLFFRVRDHNSFVVNLPGPASKGMRMTLAVMYAGHLDPQPTDREVVALEAPQDVTHGEPPPVTPEESYLYSNRTFWYVKAAFDDFAPATLALTVPSGYTCVATGTPQTNPPSSDATADQAPGRTFRFAADQPVKYLSCLISRFVMVRTATVQVGEPVFGRTSERPAGVFYDGVELRAFGQPRQLARTRQLADRAAEILRFYSSILGDFPYPSMSLGVVEAELPGGHGPAYMTVLNQTLAGSQVIWRGDPASFDDFPEYFLAHELAHQWWGQAVGWKSYHEQWLSEGFAQYFAALYAEQRRGHGAYESMIRRMRRFGQDQSEKGPVVLGYRIGHLKGDSRLFRAVVYDKGAVVLHMLRRLVGDDAFFRGLRRYYLTYRFKKAGTLDLQRAFEAETGESLARFFDRWIYGSTIPHVRVTMRTGDGEAGREELLRFEQIGEVFDLPVTVTLDYADRAPETVLVKLTDQVTETRIPLHGTLRKVDVNRDEGAIGAFIRELP